MAKNDTDVILSALHKERQLAHQKVMQLDRIIKRIKEGNYAGEVLEIEPIESQSRQPVVFTQSFKTADTKVQILRVFDVVRIASKLQVIQDKFNELTQTNYNIRDIIRSLQRSGKVRMMKEKNASRGFLWVKSEWLDNGQLLEEFKPEGFDMLYKPEDLIFE